MILQIIAAIAGATALTASAKGLKADEEKYLQYNLNFENWVEEEKKIENEVEIIRWRNSEYKRCRCQDLREKEWMIEKGTCLYHRVFKYAHWLRGKIISTEVQKEELKDLVENTQRILQVLEETCQHEKEEWELNNAQLKATSESEDYEIIDRGILELEKEKTEWQKILTELESKLNSL